ncbi:MAG: L,D-transpeptidase family protein [Nevskia sp.]|jgi:murein L,D-transpeptidase YafK|nr:L,D-transpeptidase family protein [Nevskia sp.]
MAWAMALSGALLASVPLRASDGAVLADRVLVEKAQRRLILFHGNTVLKTYSIALGRHPVGPKRRKGDGRTPEGHYVVDGRNPDSRFHRSLHLSYPNAEDRAWAAAHGVDPGQDIAIHGVDDRWGWSGPSHWSVDWTQGCIAVSDPAIDEIWQLVPDGTPVDIVP